MSHLRKNQGMPYAFVVSTRSPLAAGHLEWSAMTPAYIIPIPGFAIAITGRES